MLQELLNALAPSYALAYQGLEYQFPPVPGFIPSMNKYTCVQLHNFVAILARTDIAPEKFQVSNPQSAQYLNKTSITTPLELSPNLGDGLRDQAAAIWDTA